MEDVGIPGTEGQHRAPRVRGQGSLQLLSALLLIQSIPTTLIWARSRHCLQGLSSAKHSIWSGGFFNPLVLKDVPSLGTQASSLGHGPSKSLPPLQLSCYICRYRGWGAEEGVEGGESRISKDEDPRSGTFFEDNKKGFCFFFEVDGVGYTVMYM